MKNQRDLSGQEIIEVAITGAIILALALGVVTLFGKNIQKVFQSNDSPIIVSAKMNDPNAADPNSGVGTRTDINQNLLSNAITRSNSDLTIGSSLGQETTGAAGGDSEIGGTYEIKNYEALHDGDPSTTGNALLDAALAAKNSALELFASAESSQNTSDYFMEAASNLQQKATAYQDNLSQLNNNLSVMQDNLDQVNTSLETLVALQNAAQTVTSNLSTALNSVNNANSIIASITTNNLNLGQNLLDLNTNYETALDNYKDLQDEYNAGETTCTDADGNDYSCNTSNVSLSSISSAKAQANMLLSQAQGMANSISNSISTLQPQANSIKAQADLTQKYAKQLKSDAKKTLDVAFNDDDLFDNCKTVDQMISVATQALKNGYKVDNYWAAKNAINLLISSSEAFKDSETLFAQANQINEHIDQLETTLSAYNSNASALNLSADKYDTSEIVTLQDNTKEALSTFDSAIAQTTATLTNLQNSTAVLNNQIIYQQAAINEIQNQSTSAQDYANDAHASASSVLLEAQNSLDSANETIDSIVTFDGE